MCELPLIFSTAVSHHSTEPPHKNTTLVPRLSEASLAVPKPSKIASKGGKFKILQSALPKNAPKTAGFLKRKSQWRFDNLSSYVTRSI